MDSDELVCVLPIHYSNSLSPNVHIHQFPLLSRPLQTPPAATVSGKRIHARIKPVTRRLEIHVPVDPRPEVWNGERSKDLGAARQEDDREKNQDVGKMKQREGEEPRLTEVRMRSELIPHEGAYMLGVVRNGHLHLQPISEMHQFRPTLTVDVREAMQGSDEDSDDGPPPDPDEPPPVQIASKKEKKPLEVKEVQVSARKAADDKGNLQGGLSAVRREMLLAIRAEEDEVWQDLDFCDGEVFFFFALPAEGHEVFEAVFAQSEEHLECKSDITAFLKGIKGL
ncbi:hypothetical protein DFH29DRAFT_979160 [Suillus ampliporus]|nr:hypothetical protein DFH29DRAFT_979160 [Suillus ampliporus]